VEEEAKTCPLCGKRYSLTYRGYASEGFSVENALLYIIHLLEHLAEERLQKRRKS
jgi:hypothetical protein